MRTQCRIVLHKDISFYFYVVKRFPPSVAQVSLLPPAGNLSSRQREQQGAVGAASGEDTIGGGKGGVTEEAGGIAGGKDTGDSSFFQGVGFDDRAVGTFFDFAAELYGKGTGQGPAGRDEKGVEG